MNCDEQTELKIPGYVKFDDSIQDVMNMLVIPTPETSPESLVDSASPEKHYNVISRPKAQREINWNTEKFNKSSGSLTYYGHQIGNNINSVFQSTGTERYQPTEDNVGIGDTEFDFTQKEHQSTYTFPKDDISTTHIMSKPPPFSPINPSSTNKLDHRRKRSVAQNSGFIRSRHQVRDYKPDSTGTKHFNQY
jgi:hypothetical protein